MYVGYLFHFDREKFNKKALTNFDAPGHLASLSVEVDDWSSRGLEACLITADGENIDHVALARQGDMIVTGEYRLIFHHLANIAPVKLSRDELLQFSRISTHTCSRAPLDLWQRLVDRLAGESQDLWARLLLRMEQSRQRRDEVGYDMMAMERDAIGVALEISAFDRGAELEPREIISPGSSSYINRLRGASRDKISEDRLIDHDALVFDHLRLRRTDIIGTAVFVKEQTGERLIVTNANRAGIETTLGVDLVYVNETYKAFVMVQYKRLMREGSDYVYRPGRDGSHQKQLRRMLDYEERMLAPAPAESLDFRLNPGAFYFKLCADAFFDPLAVSMIEGMYFPVRYWQGLSESNDSMIIGARGGRRFSYDKTGRCMSNELFSKLVRFGWIGSRFAHYDMLEDCISSSLEEKRSVIVTQNVRGVAPGAEKRNRRARAKRG